MSFNDDIDSLLLDFEKIDMGNSPSKQAQPHPPSIDKAERGVNPRSKLSVNNSASSNKVLSKGNTFDIKPKIKTFGDTTPALQRCASDASLDDLISELNGLSPVISANVASNSYNSMQKPVVSSAIDTPSVGRLSPPKEKSSSSSGKTPPESIKSETKQRCVKVTLSGCTRGSECKRGLKISSFSKCACDNLICMSCNFPVCILVFILTVLCYQVVIFEGTVWNQNIASYLFFRNKMPNISALQSGLVGTYGDCVSIAHNSNTLANKVSSVGAEHDFDIDDDGNIVNSSSRSGSSKSKPAALPVLSSAANHSAAYCCQCSWISVTDEEVAIGEAVGNVESRSGAGCLKWTCNGHVAR